MKLKLTAAYTLLLVGCGGDDNPLDTTKPLPEPNPQEKYVVMDVNHQPVVDKVHYVSLGRYTDNIKTWLNQADLATDDYDSDGRLSVYDAQAAGIKNDPVEFQTVHAKDVVAFLQDNPDGLGQYSARSDVFVQGQYSVFDLLRYVVHNDNHLRFESITPNAESMFDTTEFVISYDANGDGDFTNDGENSSSSHWHFRFKPSGGDFMRETGEPDGEANYLRMDEMWAQHDMGIRFQPFNEVTTVRRHHVWRSEIERFENDGYVISEIMVKKEQDPAPYVYIRDLKVKAHNLRPDVFQPGVITGIDWFMSAIDEGYDLKLSYWPTLDTGASVNSYSVNYVDGLASNSGKGWITRLGEKDSDKDYKAKSPKCLWDRQGKNAPESAFSAAECQQDYQFSFGANVLHLMTDVWVMRYPMEFGQLLYSSHYPQWGMEEYDGTKPGKEYDFGNGDTVRLETLHAEQDTESSSVLTAEHFGWGRADCLLCHDPANGHMNGAPLPVNSTDGFDTPQAYFCATCHGSNGAPNGHGATARCFWCHSDSKTPDFHGDAFAQRTVKSQLDAINEERDIFFNNGKPVMPRDSAGNAQSYPDAGVKSGTNSDWSMSKTFPDPYSCMTCHPNS